MGHVIAWKGNDCVLYHCYEHGRNRGRYGKNEYYVRFEVLTAVTMKNAVFWDIKTQGTHYVSATEPSRLMLCKI
jgi:hypothetical protein